MCFLHVYIGNMLPTKVQENFLHALPQKCSKGHASNDYLMLLHMEIFLHVCTISIRYITCAGKYLSNLAQTHNRTALNCAGNFLHSFNQVHNICRKISYTYMALLLQN